MTEFGNLYLGNKMTGVAFFNAPWFDVTAQFLRGVPTVTAVFNPADEDRKLGLDPMLCPNGSQEEAETIGGLGIRKSLRHDLNWIGEHSNGMVAGPDWSDSAGTLTEIAFHQALGLPVWELRMFQEVAEGLTYGHLYTKSWQLPSLKALI